MSRSARALACSLFAIMFVQMLVVPAGAQEGSFWVPPRDAPWAARFTPGEPPMNPAISMIVMPLASTNAAQIAAWRDRGITTICSMNTGYWDPADPFADQFTPSMLGNRVWSDTRRWLDIRNTGVRGLMESRLALAQSMGCVGIDAQFLEVWYQNSGFYISYGDQLAYNRWLADRAHWYGLSIGLNSATIQLNELVGWFDFAIARSCLENGDCELYRPFLSAGKPVFQIEFSEMNKEVDICQASRDLSFNTIIKYRDNDTDFTACIR